MITLEGATKVASMIMLEGEPRARPKTVPKVTGRIALEGAPGVASMIMLEAALRATFEVALNSHQ